MLALLPLLAAALAGAVWLGLPRVSLYPEGISWSRVVTARDGSVLQITRTGDDQYRVFVPLASVARPLCEATIAYEDARFERHGGVDARALARALYGLASGRRAGGASTLTMQLARIRFGLSTKTVSGKIVQMLRAWQLEKYYSKEQILEAYLNLAPYGGNVQGIGTAALVYAGKPAQALTRAEALQLATLPQNPAKRRPGRAQAEDERLKRVRASLYERLIAARGWRRDPLMLACRLPGSGKAPHEARHFCRRLLAEHPGETLRSTLDRKLQNALERAAASVPLPPGGNMSLLLIHAPTRETLAYVGSTDFFDIRRNGQVDGNRSRRSPGSLLKPFLYARALEEGILCPDTLLGDVPARYADWKPENYRRLFRGPVRARDALRESLNLPAIALMERVTPFYLYDLLRKLGVPLRPRDDYGLTLALGSAEMTPCDIARLYAALADDGSLRPLRMLRAREDGGASASPPLWSESARFLVLDMLRWPDDGCSWKTGTSQNWRDGWIAAVRGDYVLVVWTGAFGGGRAGRYIGGNEAHTVMKRCWENARLPERSRPLPEDVREVELCAVSGALPCGACPHRIRGRYIAGVSSLRRCRMHRRVQPPEERMQNVPTAPGSRTGVRELWPVELAAHFARMAMPLRAARAFSGDRAPGQAPRILSPVEGKRYLTVDGAGKPASVSLLAQAAPGVTTLYWFLGKEYLGTSAPGIPLRLEARAGAHTLSVVDDAGGVSRVDVVFIRP